MDEVEPFRQAFSELVRIQAAIVDVTKAADADWRRQLIQLRRRAQTQMSDVAHALDQCRILSADTGIGRELREALSKMRSTLALHQANWSAVAIDPLNPDFVRSTAAVRAANRHFINLAHQFLGGEPDRSTNQIYGNAE